MSGHEKGSRINHNQQERSQDLSSASGLTSLASMNFRRLKGMPSAERYIPPERATVKGQFCVKPPLRAWWNGNGSDFLSVLKVALTLVTRNRHPASPPQGAAGVPANCGRFPKGRGGPSLPSQLFHPGLYAEGS